MDMLELTEPGKPTEMIRINTGEIPLKDWLKREKARVEKGPERTAVIVKKHKLWSLWGNRVAGKSWGRDMKLEELLKI